MLFEAVLSYGTFSPIFSGQFAEFPQKSDHAAGTDQEKSEPTKETWTSMIATRLIRVYTGFTPLYSDGFSIHIIDIISMGLHIVYFKGSKDLFLSVKFV